VRSSVLDTLPARVRRSLSKFGADLRIARQKRHLTIRMVAERMGVARATYQRIEKGDPTVSLGAYAMALFVLGMGDLFGQMIDASRDDQGLLLDAQRLPKRVRPAKESPRS
jgi:transcriptional regulator with XRE-family HTH domain